MRQLLSRMDTHTLVLDLAKPIDRAPALQGFSTIWVDEYTLEVAISSNASVSDLFAELSWLKIEVRSLRNKTNRLEELFIRMTGNEA